MGHGSLVGLPPGAPWLYPTAPGLAGLTSASSQGLGQAEAARRREEERAPVPNLDGPEAPTPPSQPPRKTSWPYRPQHLPRHTEAFLGKEEGSPSQTAVKASDAAHGELQSKEEQQHQKGSNRDSQSSAQHRNQGRVPAAEQGEPRLLSGAADSGSENPRPSPPSLTSSATQVAGHKRPAPNTNAP